MARKRGARFCSQIPTHARKLVRSSVECAATRNTPSLDPNHREPAEIRPPKPVVVASFVAPKTIPAVVKQAQVPRLRRRPRAALVLFRLSFPLFWWFFFLPRAESLPYRVSHTRARAHAQKRALSIEREKERARACVCFGVLRRAQELHSPAAITSLRA
jgi:hypothetical protein